MIMRPSRYRNSVVPHIYVEDAAQAINFYKLAFGAEELFRIADHNGKIIHSEVSICGSTMMIGDPLYSRYGDPRRLGASTVSLHVFTEDNVALLHRAIAAGAEEVQPPTDTYFGANSTTLRDPFGHVWALLTWHEDFEPAEIESRARAALAN